MKRILRLGGVVFGVLFLALSGAAICPAAEYKADMIRQEGGRETTGKLYAAGPKIRLEMIADGQDMVTLIDRDKEKLYLIRPKAKIYLEKPFGVALSTVLMTEEGLAGVGKVEKLGQETLDGLECDKIKVVYHNEQNGEALIWRARKLDFPIKIVSQSSRGETIVRYTNVECAFLDQGLFDLPEGYSKIAPRQAPAPKTE